MENAVCGNKVLVRAIREALPGNSKGKYDLLSVFAKKEILSAVAEALSADFYGRVEYVVAPEALGWILGTAIAKKLDAGFFGIRKEESLPYSAMDVFTESFTDYSKREKRIGVPLCWPVSGRCVLIVDDWIQTGAQIEAVLRICQRFGCPVAGIAAMGADRCAKVQEWDEQGLLRCIGYDI